MPLDFSIYLITDRRSLPEGRDLLTVVRSALEGGVRGVQLREKDLCAAELLPLARDMRALTREFGARLLINDRIDVALAVDADGVHLGGHSLPASAARKILGPDKLIGVSTHGLENVAAAADAGADFATFGPVWFTPSKAPYGDPVGLAPLRNTASANDLPLFPLGGVTADRLPELISAGVPRAACIGAILNAPDPAAAARTFLDLLPQR